MKKLIIFVALLLVIYNTALAQNVPAYYNEIQDFKRKDSISFPEKGSILFVGSSSIRLWKDLPSYFPNHKIINRGFGGSVLPDVIHFANDIILPYAPKQVVIYCGENDLASSPTVTADSVFDRFERLFSIIRSNLPAAKISFISIKPSPSRAQLFDKVKESNLKIRKFLKKQENTSYIDVVNGMLEDGKVRTDIFLADNLHMNEKGYAIWQKQVKKHLIK